MIASLLITFREVIEAALIVATILGILTKLQQKTLQKTVWLATAAAVLVSVFLLGVGTAVGLQVQTLYEGHEAMIAGILMTLSAVFITWAVFFLHTYFGKYKTRLLSSLRSIVETKTRQGIFLLVFTAVFREGFEIVLFLSTIYFSASPQAIFGGFAIGGFLAILVSVGLFTATVRLPVFYAFRVSSLLLILFAAGLLASGVGEFTEIGWLPKVETVTFALLPTTTSFIGDITRAIFGVTRYMNLLQVSLYLLYVWIMHWWVFVRNHSSSVHRKT